MEGRAQQASRAGMIHNSDRGSQYCAHEYQKLVKQIRYATVHVAPVELLRQRANGKLWGSLENELVHHQRYATRADATAVMHEYIESFYNRQRRRSRLRIIPPALFAAKSNKQRQAA